MTREKKLALNSISSLAYQVITIVCGFILPRFFLSYYGSAVNGLVSSITQFLGFISLAECGVGAVVQSTLYKPLAERDMVSVSKIVLSAERFFRKIAYLLAGYTLALMLVYPLITLRSFDYLFTLLLIFIISISSFAQYYLGMTYKILLNADQLGYIQYTLHAAALLLNTVSCVVLMKTGASIQVVKLATSVFFLLQPLLLATIAKKKYAIDHTLQLTEEPIQQKWNGLAQHIATVVLGNTDTVVLTLLSTLENVSVYAVYHLVVNGIKQIVVALTNGMQAMLGNMLAKNEREQLNATFDQFEWLLHTVVTFVFSATAVLIVPFVRVYTANVTDANYTVPTFAALITLAQAAYCLRLPYNIMVLAAGHYKQTQWSAIIEAGINIIVSVVLVFRFGLIGVAIGTLAAMTYRTVYLAHYLSHQIIYRPVKYFVKHILADSLSVILLLGATRLFTEFYQMSALNYVAWVGLAKKVSVLNVLIGLGVNAVLYRHKVSAVIKKYKKKKG